MKTIAGAIVLLAGVIAIASMIVADAIQGAANKNTAWLTPWYILGGILVFVGLVFFMLGWLLDSLSARKKD